MRPCALRIILLFATSLTLSLFATIRIQATPGDLDLSFGVGGRVTSPGFYGRAIAVQADGKILAVGNGLERYDSDGSLDTSFGNGGRVVLHDSVVPGCFDPHFGDACQFSPFSVAAVEIQADGKIIVAGNGLMYVLEGMMDVWVFALTRYNTDGSLDASFGTAGRVVTYGSAIEGGPRALAIQSDGKIVAAGYKRDSSWDFLTARYHPNGSLDTFFGTGGLVITSFGGIADEANDVSIQSDGKIVVGGQNRNGMFQGPFLFNFALVRYDVNGSIDPSFGTGGKVVTPFGDHISRVEQIAIQLDGKIVAAGSGGDHPNTGFALARYNADGSLDPSFGTGGKVLTLFVPGYGGAGTVALGSDNKIVASGYRYEGSNSSIALARYNTDGSLDSSFGSGGNVFTPFGDISLGNDAAIQSDGKILVLASSSYPAPDYALFRYRASDLTVANIEELYSAVNDPKNAGRQIDIAPGVYMLSVNDPSGSPRPNGGRIELQENMSLQGVTGNRSAVVIDAMDLPESSYINVPPLNRTGPIRMGRGANSIEWLTVKNAITASSNIETDLVSTSTIHIRVAHVSTSNSQRGIDVRNVGPAMAGRVIHAEIVDNDIFDHIHGTQGEAVRIANNADATGGVITAALSGNRSFNNYLGLIITDNGSDNATISVTSTGDRFFENGLGVLVSGGLTLADGNTVSFYATGSAFENNNGVNNFDHGGLIALGGENLLIPNGTSNNTVDVVLRYCRLANNQKYDLAAIGARSNPVSIGPPGSNNHVTVRLHCTQVPTLFSDDSIPDYPEGMNSAMVIKTTTPFDFDGDCEADISVFRPSAGNWYLDRSQEGFYAAQFGISSDKIVPADYDGDGKVDIAVFRPSQGTWYVTNSSDGTFRSNTFGLAYDIPTPADHDDDGHADLSVFRPSDGTWYRSDSSNGQFHAVQFGQNGDIPMTGDRDADRKSDLTVFRPSNGYWYVLRSSDNGVVLHNFGLNGDIPLKGDFDADGSADLAVFRPSNGTWYIARQTGIPAQNFDAIQFGLSTDIPVPADYDGDGKADIGVYRNGVWYLQQSTSALTVRHFGLTSDIPLAGR